MTELKKNGKKIRLRITKIQCQTNNATFGTPCL